MTNSTEQDIIKEIRTQEDLKFLQRGNVFMLKIPNRQDYLTRVLRPVYEGQAAAGKIFYLDVVYREDENTIIDGSIIITNSQVKRDGTVIARLESYNVGRRTRATDFNTLDAFLQETEL